MCSQQETWSFLSLHGRSSQNCVEKYYLYLNDWPIITTLSTMCLNWCWKRGWCALSTSSEERYNDPMVDVERLITNYAWKTFAMPTFMQRLMKDRKYKIEVDWDSLEITHRTPNLCSLLNGDCEISEVTRPLCLFETEFTNESKETQNFTFKTARTTTLTCSITLHQGLKIGEKIDCKIALPKVLRIELTDLNL